MEERRGRPKALHVEVKTVDVNVSAVAREAGLSEAVACSPELLAYTALLIDVVMAEQGVQKTGEQWVARERRAPAEEHN